MYVDVCLHAWAFHPSNTEGFIRMGAELLLHDHFIVLPNWAAALAALYGRVSPSVTLSYY